MRFIFLLIVSFFLCSDIYSFYIDDDIAYCIDILYEIKNKDTTFEEGAGRIESVLCGVLCQLDSDLVDTNVSYEDEFNLRNQSLSPKNGESHFRCFLPTDHLLPLKDRFEKIL